MSPFSDAVAGVVGIAWTVSELEGGEGGVGGYFWEDVGVVVVVGVGVGGWWGGLCLCS